MTYTLLELSAWTLVLFNAERFVAVVWPLEAGIWCRRKTAIIAWSTMTLLIASFNSIFILAYDIRIYESQLQNGTGGPLCDTYDMHYHYWAPMNETFFPAYPTSKLLESIVRNVLVSFLPTVFIFAFNLAIIITLCQRKKERKRRGALGELTTASDASTNATLITVSVTYFILTFPWAVLDLEREFNNNIYSDLYYYFRYFWWSLMIKRLKTTFRFLLHLNSCFNFLLYCVSGSKFRRALCRLWKTHCSNSLQSAS
jgi:hypothetical protein